MTDTRDAELRDRPEQLLQWSLRSSERETVVELVGEVDLATADALSQVLRDAMDGRPARLAVDVARVSFLDSTGISCLLAAERRGSEMGCRLVVRNPTVAISRVFEICGVDQILLEHVDREPTESLA
jgi:anti-sigma B factor antagonist